MVGLSTFRSLIEQYVWRIKSFCVALVLSLCCVWSLVTPAYGIPAAAAPAWRTTVVAFPTVQAEEVGRKGQYDVVVENVGAKPSAGEVTVKDILPPGLSALAAIVRPGGTCSRETGSEVVCTFSEAEVPSGFTVVTIEYEVSSAFTGSLRDRATVSGGGPEGAAEGEAVTRGGIHGVAPGITRLSFQATGPAGEPFVQAGGHPHFVTTTLLLNDVRAENVNPGEAFKPVAQVKNLEFYIPLGFLGDAMAANECPASLVEGTEDLSGCPQSSRVGTVLPMIVSSVAADDPDATHEHGIYSVTPEKGYAAEFAFAGLSGLTFFMYANVVRHNGQYLVRISMSDLPAAAQFVGIIATFYGDIQEYFTRENQEPAVVDRGAFLTLPSNCEESPQAREAQVEFDTWKEPGVMHDGSTEAFPTLEGCNLLNFTSTLSVSPETTQAEAPSGYELGLKVPQAPNGGTGLGTPPLKNYSLTLPAGTTLAPGAAHLLVACQETGPEGINIEGAESEEVAADGLQRPAAGHCPKESAVATVKATSPLLREPLEGHLYVAQPECGGEGQEACSDAYAQDGRLYRLYLEVQAPEAGVVVKLAGHASVNPGTGQITTVFEENPQFPLSDLVVTTTEGADAPLANPATCGPALSEGHFSSWAEPLTPEAQPSDFFDVNWNGAGERCPVTAPFAPSFVAGTTSQVAAATSPFTLDLGRADREQNVLALKTTLPQGLLAYVSRVHECSEPAASEDREGACSAEDQIGTVTVGVGSGSDPYYVTGKVYFTGPYGGAPFGLTIVIPAVAGPFNLGDVLVRARLAINPITAQVTAESTGFPQMLDGVPVRVRSVALSIDAHEFVLNPTGCGQLAITGTVVSATGTEAGVSSPFATQNCHRLQFSPTVTESTEASATKTDGTGVKIKIAYPAEGQANLAKTTLSFPTQLPVRLETLHQACPQATFQANPAGCPAASSVGSATVHTPILANPLTGPIYLVSNGSAKFPNVAIVLQGEGVTVVMEGESNVSSKGVLKATFGSVPDAPFSTFEASLPRRPFSEFTSARTVGRAQASQCGQELLAPVAMTAQNGLTRDENVKVQIEGCPPARPEVSVVKARAGKRGLTVTVRTSMKGRLQITGQGLKTLVRPGVGKGKHTYTLPYTKTGRIAADRHHTTHLTVTLTAGKHTAAQHKNIAL